MSSESVFTGKSVDEAVTEGLRALGLRADEADIEVISRGSRGIFGLGSEPAQVRISQRQQAKPATPPAPAVPPPAPEVVAEPETPEQAPVVEAMSAPAAREDTVSAAKVDAETSAEHAPDEETIDTSQSTPEEDEQLVALGIELLSELVRLMGFDADVIAEWHEPDADNEHRYLLLDLQGKDLSPLIGRRGDTLGSMQYLVRLMVNQRLHQWKNIVVDVEGYRQRRIEHLSQLALRSAQQVAQTGRPLSLEPMPANERRIIHLTLRDNPNVYTESAGEGARRKVQILPRKT